MMEENRVAISKEISHCYVIDSIGDLQIFFEIVQIEGNPKQRIDIVNHDLQRIRLTDMHLGKCRHDPDHCYLRRQQNINRRLDARLAAAVMSIPAIKGVEIGSAFDNARLTGTQVHDEMLLSSDRESVIGSIR